MARAWSKGVPSQGEDVLRHVRRRFKSGSRLPVHLRRHDLRLGGGRPFGSGAGLKNRLKGFDPPGLHQVQVLTVRVSQLRPPGGTFFYASLLSVSSLETTSSWTAAYPGLPRLVKKNVA